MKLSIAEGYYLIALDDEEGRILAAAEKKVNPGVLAACLLELYLMKKISIDEKGVVKVTDKTGTGNGILDNVLAKVQDGRSVEDEVRSLVSAFKDIQIELNELLGKRGILKKEETKLLWIPLSERMNNANYAFEEDIRKTLRAIVFKKAKPNPAFVILYVLIYASEILEEVFRDHDEMIDAEKVGKDIISDFVNDMSLAEGLEQVKKVLATY